MNDLQVIMPIKEKSQSKNKGNKVEALAAKK